VSAAKAGFESYVIEEAQRCVDPSQGWSDAKGEFAESNVRLLSIDSEEVQRVKKT
jgi:hypothetical protein